jgi:hypothetical protein
MRRLSSVRRMGWKDDALSRGAATRAQPLGYGSETVDQHQQTRGALDQVPTALAT